MLANGLLVHLDLAALFLGCAVEVIVCCFIGFGLNFNERRIIEMVEFDFVGVTFHLSD